MRCFARTISQGRFRDYLEREYSDNMSAEALRTFPSRKDGDDIVHTRSNVRINVSDWS